MIVLAVGGMLQSTGMTLRLSRAVLILGLGTFLISTPSFGQGTCADKSVAANSIRNQDDIRAFVQCASEYLRNHGVEEAYRAFHEDERWRSGQFYVFASNIDSRGENVLSFLSPANRSQEGKYFGTVIDRFGNDYFKELFRIIDGFGEGWIYYSVRNPATGRDEPKASYIVTVDWNGTPAYLGAGIYLRGLPGTCDALDVDASALASEPNPDRLRQFVRCAAYVMEDRGYFATAELRRDSRWRAESVYLFGMDSIGTQFFTGNPVRINGMDMPEWGDQHDSLGPFGGRNVTSVVGALGETFLYYNSFNPASGRLQRKVAFVKRVVAQGVPVLIGSGYYLPDATDQ